MVITFSFFYSEFKATSPDNLFNDMYAVINDTERKALFPSYDIKLIDVMNTWINQPGHPVVTVTRDYKSNTAVLKQERFFLSHEPKVSEEKWYIPVTYALQDNASMSFDITIPHMWIEPNKAASISDLEPEQWIIVNNQQTGQWNSLVKINLICQMYIY